MFERAGPTLRYAVLLSLPFLLGACAAALQPRETALLQQNRYAELRELMEARVLNPAQATTYDLFYLCYAYSRVRQYDRLFPCLDRLQASIDRGDTRIYWFDFRASAVLMRAQAAIEFGDFPGARTHAERALHLTQSADTYLQMRIYALTAAGLAHALGGDRAAARLDAAKLAALNPDTVTASDKYIGLARIYMALGHYRRALDALAEDDKSAAFKSFVDLVSGASLAGESIFLYWELPKQYIRSRALLETGDVAAARQGYDALLARPGTAQSGDLYWLILFDRGTISEREGDRAGAIEYYRRAIEVIERQRASIPVEAGKIGFVGDKQQVYRRLVSALVAVGRTEDAFIYAERSKARALVDMLAGRRRFAAKERSPAKTAALIEELDRLQRASLLDDPAAGVAQRTRAAVDDLHQRLRRETPELASLVTVTAASLEEVRATLGADEALIEYYGEEDGLFAFVLDRENLRVVRLDGSGLVDAVRRFRTAITELATTTAAGGRELHRRLIAPLGALPERLVIVPHGALHYLPFTALHDGRAYLLETASLRFLPSASAALYLANSGPPAPLRLLVLANPALGDPNLDLPGAEVEAHAIRALWPDAKVLLRAQATKSVVKRSGGEFRYLHFATHGKFNADDPLASGLALANDAESQGWLTVDELYDLRLNADLVTLSACDTALGVIASGDDVIGLSRGFLYAGTRSIVATLWPIVDKQTAYLMGEFYSNLRRTSKQAALRRAQLAALQRYPAPLFWAAFQLIGRGT